MNFIKRFSLFETLLVAAIFCIHLYAALSDAYNLPSTWFIRDDAYYYFKIAQNISEGLGSTFDGINLTNGYHPLWLLICIPVFAFARLDLILPLRILLMVMAGFNAATSVLIYRLIKNNLSLSAAYFAAFFWAFNSYIQFNVYKPGLETPLAAFAIILFIYKLSQFEKEWRTKPVTPRQILAMATLATIVLFSRLDLIFLTVISGIWIIFRGKPIRFLLPFDLIIIFISMTSSVALRTGIENYNSIYADSTLNIVVVMLMIKIIMLFLFGAYQHPRANSILNTIRQTGIALTISLALGLGIYLLFFNVGFVKSIPSSAFVLDWGLSVLLILLLRLAAHWFGDQKINIGIQNITPLNELRANWKKWFTEGACYYGILGGALSLYMLYNKFAFGTSSPISGQVKRWWGSLIDTVYEKPAHDWPEFLGISFHWSYNVWQLASSFFLWVAQLIYPLYPGAKTAEARYYISMFAVILIALIIFFLNSRRTLKAYSDMALIPLAAGCGFQILSYTTTAYGGMKEWYWVSQMLFVTLAGSLLLDLALRPLQKIKAARLTLEIVSIAFGIYWVRNFGYYIAATMPYNYFPADRPYMDVVPYLEENTPPGSIIGMTGGGNVGYFIHDRTIVNMDGLINSYEYFQALQNEEAPIFLSEHGVRIIFASKNLLSYSPYNNQFAPYLLSYNVYGGKGLFNLLDKPKY